MAERERRECLESVVCGVDIEIERARLERLAIGVVELRCRGMEVRFGEREIQAPERKVGILAQLGALAHVNQVGLVERREAEETDRLHQGDAGELDDLRKHDIPVLKCGGRGALADLELRAGEDVARQESDARLAVADLVKAERRGEARLEIALQERIEPPCPSDEVGARRGNAVERGVGDGAALLGLRRPLVEQPRKEQLRMRTALDKPVTVEEFVASPDRELGPRLLQRVGSVSLSDEAQHRGGVAIDRLAHPPPGLLVQIRDGGALLKEAAVLVFSAAAAGTGIIAPDSHGRHFRTPRPQCTRSTPGATLVKPGPGCDANFARHW